MTGTMYLRSGERSGEPTLRKLGTVATLDDGFYYTYLGLYHGPFETRADAARALEKRVNGGAER